MSKKLCTTCEFYGRIESGEVGVVFEQCNKFEISLSDRGVIKSCTGYSATNTPYLIAREAWDIRKGDDGKFEFTDPKTYRTYYVDTKGKVRMRPKDKDDD